MLPNIITPVTRTENFLEVFLRTSMTWLHAWTATQAPRPLRRRHADARLPLLVLLTLACNWLRAYAGDGASRCRSQKVGVIVRQRRSVR
jgi:hypothetical protein